MRKVDRRFFAAPLLSAILASVACADVFNMPNGQTSLQFVTVGDPGNAADTTPGDGSAGFGSVPYICQMGKYDVTIAQYATFLNAVAASDTYGLYNPLMANGFPTFGIARNGSANTTYTYSVVGNGSMPVAFVSWGDAARFCNWLNNGQPTGLQGDGTTETGAYTLHGATSDPDLLSVSRNPGSRYVIPSENEWYKAAHYKGGGTNAGYWLYPTQSDTAPINTLPDTGNHANFYDSSGTGTNGYTDPINRLTPVGTFTSSPGPYGTYDQGGDVYQWVETNVLDLVRVERGGSYGGSVDTLASTYRAGNPPSNELYVIGFRIAAVPEPQSVVIALLGGGLMWWWSRRP